MSSEDLNSIKRRRVARACDTCRRKKVRCDGVQPGSDPPSCTNCKAYGYECAFIDAPKKRGPPKGYIEALETRLQRMESILGGLVQSGDLPEGTISSNLEWINVNESNFRSGQESNISTSSRLRKSPSFNPTRNSKSSTSKSLVTSGSYKNNNGQNSDESEECFSSDSNEYSGSQYDLNDSMGQLAMDESGHTKYLGNSSGVFLLKITKKVANGQIITVPSYSPNSLKRIGGSSIVYELPPKDLCDKLLDAYWSEVHPYMPFIDKQDLMEKYKNLEANSSSIILLYAMFAIASKHVNDPVIQVYSQDFLGSHFYNKAASLLKDEFDKPSLSIIQALVLLSGHIHGHKDSVTWVYIGLAIRTAQDMGLHRDPAKWNFDERQGEIRKRVWWSCFVIDRFISAGLGRPLAINEMDCDVDYPTFGKLPDDDEDAIEGWVQLIKCISILGRILNHIYSIKSKTTSQNNVESVLVSLDNELNEWRDNLPKKFQFDSTTMYPGDTNSNRKMVIHLLYYTQQILLHRPHIRGPKSKAPPSSIPSLTICTMAANNITHILYRVMKDGNLRLSGVHTIYSFSTAASMHIINALSGDDRFREVAKHGLRMTLKCLDYMSDYWFATDKLSFLIKDLLKSKDIELDGLQDSTNSTNSTNSAKKIPPPGGYSKYAKFEDAEGNRINPFLHPLSNLEGQIPLKITFASSLPTSPNLQNQQDQQHHQQQDHRSTYPPLLWVQQQQHHHTPAQSSTPVLSSVSSGTNSPQSITKSPPNDAMQYERTSSPESTTSSSSGLMQFTELLATDNGLFPQNADTFNNPVLFEIDDPMGNSNPFLSLPSAIDWNEWTDWTEYFLRMRNNPTSSANMMNVPTTNPVVSNPNMQSNHITLMNATSIPSMAGNNNNMTLI